MYTALKPMRIGDRDVQPGETTPEAETFEPQALKRLVNQGYIVDIPAEPERKDKANGRESTQ